MGLQIACNYVTENGGSPEQLAVVAFGQGGSLINLEGVRKALHLRMRHRGKVTEGIGVGQVAVLAEGFSVIATLNIVKASGIPAVVAGIDPSLGINLNPKGIAATLGEDLESMGLGMVTPSKLTHAVNRLETGQGLVVRAVQNDVGRHCTPMRGVHPTIRSPAQVAGNGVGVLQTEAGQQDARSGGVGTVVTVLVGVKQQVGRVQHEDATTSLQGGSCEIKSVEKHLVGIKDTVAVGVLMNGDAVLAEEGRV